MSKHRKSLAPKRLIAAGTVLAASAIAASAIVSIASPIGHDGTATFQQAASPFWGAEGGMQAPEGTPSVRASQSAAEPPSMAHGLTGDIPSAQRTQQPRSLFTLGGVPVTPGRTSAGRQGAQEDPLRPFVTPSAPADPTPAQTPQGTPTPAGTPAPSSSSTGTPSPDPTTTTPAPAPTTDTPAPAPTTAPAPAPTTAPAPSPSSTPSESPSPSPSATDDDDHQRKHKAKHRKHRGGKHRRPHADITAPTVLPSVPVPSVPAL